MRVDTSQVEGEIGNAISLLQQFQNATNDLEIKQKVGADTSEAESKVNSLASEIEGISPDIKAKLNIDSTSVDSIKTSIAGLSAETINVKANVDASAIDGYNPESKKCDVIYDPKTDLLPESFSSINRTVNYIANTANLPSSFSTIMVYGTTVWANSGYEVGCINSQFPLFALAPEYIHRRFAYWLRGVGGATSFAGVGNAGGAGYYGASFSLGVRPFFFVN